MKYIKYAIYDIIREKINKPEQIFRHWQKANNYIYREVKSKETVGQNVNAIYRDSKDKFNNYRK